LRQQFEQSEKDSAELRMQVEAALCHTMQEDTAELKALEDTHEDTKKQLKVEEETGASQEAIESLQQQLKASQEKLDNAKRALMTFRAVAAAEDNDDDWDPHEAASEI